MSVAVSAMRLTRCLDSRTAFVCSHMAFASVCHLFLYVYVFVCHNVLCLAAY